MTVTTPARSRYAAPEEKTNNSLSGWASEREQERSGVSHDECEKLSFDDRQAF